MRHLEDAPAGPVPGILGRDYPDSDPCGFAGYRPVEGHATVGECSKRLTITPDGDPVQDQQVRCG